METNFNTISIEPRSQDSAAAPSTTKRRFGTNGGLWYLNRAIVYTLYLPIIFAARLFLNTARLHGEARSISIIQDLIELPRLPAVFQGLRIAFLTDFHCGPLTPASFLERVVDETLKHKPDVILLGGDYVTDGADYIHAIEQVLARLDAPLGVYGVLGNHEFESDVEAVRRALRRAGVVELTNRGCWLERGDSRIRIAGVGDLWCDEQDLSAALAGTERSDTVVLLSHNPDYVMEIDDPRVGLVLSGHTHGGQVQLPRLGPLFTNSRHGKRLVQGRVSIPPLQLYVSRGIGTVILPQLSCLLSNQVSDKTRIRNRSKLARPYIWRFMSLSRLTCPSSCPLLHASVSAARIAERSLLIPSAKLANSGIPLSWQALSHPVSFLGN